MTRTQDSQLSRREFVSGLLILLGLTAVVFNRSVSHKPVRANATVEAHEWGTEPEPSSDPGSNSDEDDDERPGQRRGLNAVG